jgi:cell division protein FtsA
LSVNPADQHDYFLERILVVRKALTRTKGGVIAALDVGSTKTCCFIAKLGETKQTNLTSKLSNIRILGIGHNVADGIRNGAVVDMEASEVAIRRAVQAAETMAKETIDKVYINLSGGKPTSHSIGVELAINGHQIVEADISKVLEQGKNLKISEDRDLVHLLPVDFSIDGNRGIKDPCGMAGKNLVAKMHIVTAASGPKRNLATVVERCHLGIQNYVVSPYASGLACLVEDEIDLGVTVIDMGGGTTTIAIFFDGSVIFTDSLPIGGTHVTNDIARGLSTSIIEAERLKTLHGSATLSAVDDRELIEVPQIGDDTQFPMSQVPKSKLVGIIQPRLEEVLELIKLSIVTSGLENIAGRRVVLTGGASQLPGLSDLAQIVLNKQVRLGRPIRTNGLADAVSGPAFSTCVGLLAYAIDPSFDNSIFRVADKIEPTGVFGRVGSWIRENF